MRSACDGLGCAGLGLGWVRFCFVFGGGEGVVLGWLMMGSVEWNICIVSDYKDIFMERQCYSYGKLLITLLKYITLPMLSPHPYIITQVKFLHSMA